MYCNSIPKERYLNRIWLLVLIYFWIYLDCLRWRWLCRTFYRCQVLPGTFWPRNLSQSKAQTYSGHITWHGFLLDDWQSQVMSASARAVSQSSIRIPFALVSHYSSLLKLLWRKETMYSRWFQNLMLTQTEFPLLFDHWKVRWLPLSILFSTFKLY